MAPRVETGVSHVMPAAELHIQWLGLTDGEDGQQRDNDEHGGELNIFHINYPIIQRKFMNNITAMITIHLRLARAHFPSVELLHIIW